MVGAAVGATVLGLLVAGSMAVAVPSASATGDVSRPGRVVDFAGYQLRVPGDWSVVDLTRDRNACVRFDRPALYLGPTGDQASCPARLLGGAPTVHVEAADAEALARAATDVVVLPASERPSSLRLPPTGPFAVALQGARLLLTARYGPDQASLIHHIVANSAVLPAAHGQQPVQVGQDAKPHGVPGTGFSVPGEFQGPGFDTCAAPPQVVMDAWRASSGYGSIGVYVGGVMLGCDQPSLSAPWVTRQVRRGWHIVPVYVGLQAPCSNFLERMSYDVTTARAQGEADAQDAMALAGGLGIVAPSTVYADVEGYDSTESRCVDAVLSYLAGWTFAMHTQAYQAGVYSSAASGMHDLSTHYSTLGAGRPDDLFMAWWNHRDDVSGGRYVPRVQWSYHQRVHQYEGQQDESHDGYSLLVDRNYLDVSPVVPEPQGCPADLDFPAYHVVRWPAHNDQVRAAQCLLARNGFAPGPATGILNWRTAAAIKAFKASRGLSSTDSSLARYSWTALTSGGSTAMLHLGSKNPCVRKVQRALIARLQQPLRINGVFDDTTAAAVKAYQRLVGMAATGTVGMPTWRALQAGR
jgi:hypothetical protein